MSAPAKTPPDPVAAALMHCMALRHLFRYAAARDSAEHQGADLSEHGDAPSTRDVARRYKALAEEWLPEDVKTAAAAIASVEFAAAVLADQMVDRIFDGGAAPIRDEEDKHFALMALGNAAGWINQHAARELLAEIRALG